MLAAFLIINEDLHALGLMNHGVSWKFS